MALKIALCSFWYTDLREEKHELEHAISKPSKAGRKLQSYFFVEQNSTNALILARASDAHDSFLGD